MQDKSEEVTEAGQRTEQAKARAEELQEEGLDYKLQETMLQSEAVQLREAVRERDMELSRTYQKLKRMDAKLAEQESRSETAREVLLRRLSWSGLEL